MVNTNDAEAKAKGYAIEVSEALKTDVILYAGAIYAPYSYELAHLILKNKKHDNVMVCLTTEGGSADEAFKIARLIQSSYPGTFRLFVNVFCKSAGTLIALGADEIIMSDMAELGPLDVQVWKQDEVGERTSGLTPLQALTTLQQQSFDTFVQHFAAIRRRYGPQITTRSATQIAARLTIGCFNKIYQQIDPMKLGEHQRAMLIAQEYGKRLARKNLRKEAIDKLISNYPSHGFAIDRNEAEALFHQVREPSLAEGCMGAYLLHKAFSVHAEDRLSDHLIEFLSAEPPSGDDKDGGANDGQSAGAGEVPEPSESGGSEPSGEAQPKPAPCSSTGAAVPVSARNGDPAPNEGAPEL